MKALSLKQPWLNLILWEYKTKETRWWQRKFRGDLLLCASKKSDSLQEFTSIYPGKFTDLMNQVRYDKHDTNIFSPCSVALCVVEVVDIRPMQLSDEDLAMVEYNVDRYVWDLKNVRPIKPFPVKGQLGIFESGYTKEMMVFL